MQPPLPQNDDGYVSGRFLDDFLGLLSARRIQVSTLISGLEIDRESLRQGHPLVPWPAFTELLARLEAEVGGPAGLEKLGEDISRIRVASILRRMAGLTASPLLLYRAAERWALRRAIPVLESRIEVVEPGQLSVTCVIPSQYRACPQLLHFATGVLRCAPRILDLPDSVVAADVQPGRGHYRVILPRSATLFSRVRAALRALLSARATLNQLELQQGELRDHFMQLRASYAVLEESEARFRALTETAVDVVVEIGGDGKVQYVSPSMAELTGHAPDRVAGSGISEWIHPEDLAGVQQELHGVFTGTSRGRPVLRIRHADGHWITVEAEGRTYRAGEGDVRAVVIVRDITTRVTLDGERQRYAEELEAEVARRTEQLERRNLELRELQSLLLHAERLDTAQDLAGQIAHSINNPLGALIGYLQLSLRDLAEARPGDPRELLERALVQAHRARDVVARTLDLYREGKIDRAPEDAGSILEDCVEQLSERAQRSGVRLRTDGDPTLRNDAAGERRPVRIDVDRPLLASALVAIAENAIESLSDGGTVSLGVSLDPSGSLAEFVLQDDGPGIPPEHRERIFDPFFTTKSSGSGLGLAIARGVVRGHGGDIELASRPEFPGTRVRVRIPVGAPDANGTSSDSTAR